MTGFFGRLFGSGKKKSNVENENVEVIERAIDGIIENGGFSLNYKIDFEENGSLLVDFSGDDEDMLKEREGQLLDSIQLFLKRVAQHQISDLTFDISVDCNGFRNESSQALMDLADKLKNIALEKGKSVYIRALPPKDRKIVHQYLAEDGRVKSRSVGEGHFKKIKIFPTRESSVGEQAQ